MKTDLEFPNRQTNFLLNKAVEIQIIGSNWHYFKTKDESSYVEEYGEEHFFL